MNHKCISVLLVKPKFNVSFKQNRFSLAILFLGFLACVSCRADVDVIVEVEPSGAGEVRVNVLLDDLAADGLLEFDNGFDTSVADLQLSGWEVTPTKEIDEGKIISASKRFGNPDQFSEVMEELSASDGIFRDFSLVRNKSFGRVEYLLNGTVDGSRGLNSFSDSSLENTLGPLSEFAGGNDFQIDDLGVNLFVDLPGDIKGGADTVDFELTESSNAKIPVDLDRSVPVLLELKSVSRSITAQVLRGAAVIAGLIAFLIVLSQVLKFLSGRADRSKSKLKKSLAVKSSTEKASSGKSLMRTDGKKNTESGTLQEELPDSEIEKQAQVTEPFEVIVLDGMGVLYQEKDNLENLLVPFVRQKGSSLPDEEILKKAKILTQGRSSVEDFWKSVGLDEPAYDLNDGYLSTLQLSPGVVKYMLDLAERGIKVGCLTNDVASWADTLRTKHSLESLIEIWVISGSIGLRKPSFGAFEALRRKANIDPSKVLLIDDEVEVLNQAREFGFTTNWYTESGSVDTSNGHTIFPGFPITS